MSLRVQEVVRSLCCVNGWCYGLFWGVNRRNSMLLTIEDAYCEEATRMIVSIMFQQVHMLGEGIIGEVAVTGKHQWMFSDTSYRVSGPTGSVNNQEVFQDISEFHRHFSSGIKTIVLIPVAPLGVLQFGSTEKIMESLGFVEHVKYLFQHLRTINRQLPVALNRDGYDTSNSIGSHTSFPNYVVNDLLNGDGLKHQQENPQIPTVVNDPQPFSLNPELQNTDSNSLISASFHTQSQYPTTGAEGSFILPTPNMQDSQHLSPFSSGSANTPESINPMWSGEQSSWTMFDQQMLSGMGVNEPLGAIIDNTLTPVACVNSFLNSQGDTGLSTSYDIKGIPNVMDNTSLPYEPASETPFQMFPSEAKPSSVALASTQNFTNDIHHWEAESVEHDKNVMATQVNDNLSMVHGSVHGSAYSSLNNSVDNGNAVQSSLTNTMDSLGNVGDENTNPTMLLPIYSDPFGSFGMEFGENQRMEYWDDYVLPVVSASHSSLSTGASECADFDAGTNAAPQNDFLTDFRHEQRLEGAISNGSDNRPICEDQLSPTMRTPVGIITASALRHNNQVNHANHASNACLGRSETNMENVQNVMKSTSVDDNYSINTESTSSRHSKRPEETAKAPKKKGQPREGSRPRPKDRQQIQDRVKELREIVPTGGKCSIDALLDRTIKHLLFLQSVLKYANKLKSFDDPKLIGDENGVVLKETSNGSDAIWAYGVAGQTMVCPMAEDTSPPGELSIELRCDDGGYFLEIATLIRESGLTILRGAMETQDNIIYARFTVEAAKDVTRMKIFLSLVDLMQQVTFAKNQMSKGGEGGVPAFPNYQQSQAAAPLAEPLG